MAKVKLVANWIIDSKIMNELCPMVLWTNDYEWIFHLSSAEWPIKIIANREQSNSVGKQFKSYSIRMYGYFIYNFMFFPFVPVILYG